jgi:NADPH:quinone reductase-like Zn-dependent oxidoreductase
MARSSMAAVIARAPGGPEVLELAQVSVPRLLPGYALVELRACALNHLDVWVRMGRRGRHPLAMTYPRILGSDGAGVVVDMAWVDDDRQLPVAIGDRVLLSPGHGCGTCGHCRHGDDNLCRHYSVLGVERDGTYAEYVAVPVTDLLPIPNQLSYVEAAAVPLTFITAWHMLVSKAQLRAGETVLINAVGSGVGTAALAIAKALGARVIGTASSSEKCSRATELGAEVAVDYSEMKGAVQDVTLGQGVDVAIDTVGSDTFLQTVEATRIGGRIVSCGATAEARVELDLHRLQGRMITFFFTVMGTQADLMDAIAMLERTGSRPAVDRVLPLSEATAAHHLLESRKVFGKLVLVPDAQYGAGRGAGREPRTTA